MVTINDETFVAFDTRRNEEVEARFYAYAQTKCNDELPSRRFTRVSFASDCGVTTCKIYSRAVLFMRNAAFFQTKKKNGTGILIFYNIGGQNCIASLGIISLSLSLSPPLPLLPLFSPYHRSFARIQDY